MNKNRGQGFAALSKETMAKIASDGGKAAHARGTAHKFTPEEAREAGRKGGRARALKDTQRRAERTAEAKRLLTLKAA